MILVKVGDDSTTDLSYEESIDLIKAAGLPVTMSFKKIQGITSAKGLFGGGTVAKPSGGFTFGGSAATRAHVAAMPCATLRPLLCFHHRRFVCAPSPCSGGGEGIQLRRQYHLHHQLWLPGIIWRFQICAGEDILSKL